MSLDPNTYLPCEYQKLTLYVLSDPVLHMLGLYLDKDVVPSPDGHHDFSGLANLIGLEPVVIDLCNRQKFKGLEVLMQWRDRQELNPELGNLLKHLAELGREDILTDMSPHIENDACQFVKRCGSSLPLAPPASSIPSGSGSVGIQPPDPLCLDDVMHKQVTTYDAFISYAIGDLEFVKELITKLEAKGLKLFVRERNGLTNGVSYEITTKLIQDRCRHMIAVLSPNYIQSEECHFQVHYAFQLSPAQRKRKIVPILIEECEVPEVLRIMAFCDFTKKDFRDWSWDRLIFSIMPNQSAYPELLSPSSSRSLSSSNGSISGTNSPSQNDSSVPVSSVTTSATPTSTSQRTVGHVQHKPKSTPSSTSKGSTGLGSRALQHIKAPFTSMSKKKRKK